MLWFWFFKRELSAVTLDPEEHLFFDEVIPSLSVCICSYTGTFNGWLSLCWGSWNTRFLFCSEKSLKIDSTSKSFRTEAVLIHIEFSLKRKSMDESWRNSSDRKRGVERVHKKRRSITIFKMDSCLKTRFSFFYSLSSLPLFDGEIYVDWNVYVRDKGIQQRIRITVGTERKSPFCQKNQRRNSSRKWRFNSSSFLIHWIWFTLYSITSFFERKERNDLLQRNRHPKQFLWPKIPFFLSLTYSASIRIIIKTIINCQDMNKKNRQFEGNSNINSFYINCIDSLKSMFYGLIHNFLAIIRLRVFIMETVVYPTRYAMVDML